MSPVRFEIDAAGVGVVTLCGEDRLNVFDLAMRDALLEVLALAEAHPDLRALVLRADGDNFCAGADLREFGTAEDAFDARRIRWRRDPWSVLWELTVPVVAALHGVAVGSGLEMALLCDLRLCQAGSRLGLPEAQIAMLPAAGGTQSLSRVIGRSSALPVVALGGQMSAAEALLRGIVDAVVDDVEAAARDVAVSLAGLPPHSVRAAKQALRAAADAPLEQGLATERRLARRVALGA